MIKWFKNLIEEMKIQDTKATRKKETHKYIIRKGFMFFGETLNEFLQRVFNEGKNMLRKEVERLYYEG